MRRRLLARGQAAFDAVMQRMGPWSITALLATLVLLFAFQGQEILQQPLVIALLAVPILIQVVFNSALAYGLTDPQPRPNGGTWLGYTLGTLGAGLIVWLALLGVRKRTMTRGAWSLKAWTSAHVYLGLALIVVVTLHTGFQLGWNVHTLAYVLMMVVIISGIYGVIVYVRLPSALSANRGEVTQKLMLEELRGLDRQLNTLARPLDGTLASIVLMSLDQSSIGGNFWQRLTNQHADCKTLAALTRLGQAQPTAKTAKVLEELTALLQRKIVVLAMVRRHIQIRTLLGAWLYIHIPATFALLAALTAHVISVFLYW